jgi:ribosome-associated protein
LTTQDEIHIDAQQSRSREMNRQAAIERLRQLIFQALIEPKKRKKTRPTVGSQQRRLSGKKRRSEIKKGRSGLYE